MTKDDKRQAEADKPPILGSWRQLYMLVLGNLALMVLVFYIITQYFA